MDGVRGVAYSLLTASVVARPLTNTVPRPPNFSRPRPVRTRPSHFFMTKTAFFKDHQIINPRPKYVSLRKKSGQLC